jgi:hypothetical protein
MVINEDHGTRFSITHPALPASPGSNLRASPGATGFRRTRAFAGMGWRAVPLPGFAPPPRREGPSFGVAYPLRTHSRLGCSPKFAFLAAYHTTSCEFRRNTNQCPDKKSGGLTASRSPLPLDLSCSPSSAAVSPGREAVATRSPGSSYSYGFPNRSNQEKD